MIITTSEGRQVANVTTLEGVKTHWRPAQAGRGPSMSIDSPLPLATIWRQMLEEIDVSWFVDIIQCNEFYIDVKCQLTNWRLWRQSLTSMHLALGHIKLISWLAENEKTSNVRCTNQGGGYHNCEFKMHIILLLLGIWWVFPYFLLGGGERSIPA